MTKVPPYHVDVDDAAFMTFIPEKIAKGSIIEPLDSSALDVNLENVVISKVQRLTEAINAKSDVGQYDMVRSTLTVTFKNPLQSASSVSDVEVWYHRSGCSHGKVLRVQVVTYGQEPFVKLTAARVIRKESEDVMLLRHAHSRSIEHATWERFALFDGRTE
jgi:hypothetical protein